MDKPVSPPNPVLGSLGEAADFQLCSLRVSPSRRTLEGPAGVRHFQPKVMLVFVLLARDEGKVVTRRELFETCWAGTHVGDDSLNRIITALRQGIQTVGAEEITIETVPRTGYRLVAATARVDDDDPPSAFVQAALDRWRMGLPTPDKAEIGALEIALLANGGRAGEWGVLALLLRKAVEYADAVDCADYASRCERAARRALRLNPLEANARVALAGLAPLFRNWTVAKTDLAAVLDAEPGQIAALHDLAVLEMATGRPSVAAPIVARLFAADRMAATYHYKRMYHLWTLGDLQGAEQVAAHAMALWPQHPAVWMARYWILVFTNRADQALRMALDHGCRTMLPSPVLLFLQRTAQLAAPQAAAKRNAEVDDHIGKAMEVAALGPAHAVAALLTLCALDAVDEAFQVAHGYYLGRGRSAAPLRWNAGDPCITDQHRRVTQPLFVPSGKCMRDDPRFSSLCDDLGLSAYWERFGINPDFRAAG